MLKKVKEILDKRSKINDEDDYRIEKCRDELIDALSQDELLTIDILNQLMRKRFCIQVKCLRKLHIICKVLTILIV